MQLYTAVEKIIPYIFQIHTPSGSGTGFLYGYNRDKGFCFIATALHVIDHADQWQQPIRLVHHLSKHTTFLKETERVIFPDAATDSAIIVFKKPSFELPEQVIPLLSSNKHLKVGTEVGWVGFPAIESNTLCFFSGNISARQDPRYLIDGVAIHGVSGGPVMRANKSGLKLIGIVSAYRANRVTGETLPGLLYAQDVSHFDKFMTNFKSFEDTQSKKQQESTDQSSPTDSPSPTSSKK